MIKSYCIVWINEYIILYLFVIYKANSYKETQKAFRYTKLTSELDRLRLHLNVQTLTEESNRFSAICKARLTVKSTQGNIILPHILRRRLCMFECAKKCPRPVSPSHSLYFHQVETCCVICKIVI